MDNSLINTNFVKHLMQKNNIDEKILAQKIGCTPQTIKKHLNGRSSRISIEMVMKIANIFKIPVYLPFVQDLCK